MNITSLLPTDGLSYNPQEQKYWDVKAIKKEVNRAFEICHGCRMCFKYCDSFPILFDKIDNTYNGNVKSLNKRDVFERILNSGYDLFNIVSKSAFISKDSIKGNNNFIMPNVVIEPYAEIGSDNIIWSNSTICHHTIIGNHNFLASNVTIGGKCNIGDLCFLGFSCTVSDHLFIDNEVLIAANSFLNENANSLSRMQGLPAKLHSKINQDHGIIFNNF